MGTRASGARLLVLVAFVAFLLAAIAAFTTVGWNVHGLVAAGLAAWALAALTDG